MIPGTPELVQNDLHRLSLGKGTVPPGAEVGVRDKCHSTVLETSWAMGGGVGWL